jgi:hypothetical protein
MIVRPTAWSGTRPVRLQEGQEMRIGTADLVIVQDVFVRSSGQHSHGDAGEQSNCTPVFALH